MNAGASAFGAEHLAAACGSSRLFVNNNSAQPDSVAPGAWTKWMDSDELIRGSRILVVDDEPTVLMLIRQYLQEIGHEMVFSTSESTKAVSLVKEVQPDLVLLDIVMPQVNGLEILRTLRADDQYSCLPIIIMTASADAETKILSLLGGATDFVRKPLDLTELVARVRNAVVVKKHQDRLREYARLLENQAQELEHQVELRTAELLDSRQEAIECLARAAEYRDDDTGQHVIRVGRYVGIIARELGFGEQEVATLEQAAQLHDVGKIGISDLILLKPGRLTNDEFALIKQHCEFGKKIMQRRKRKSDGHEGEYLTMNPLMKLASVIAESHHEKWNGSGYPYGLQGEEIPIEGRITAVADVYDALSTKRPYKEAFPHEKCVAILKEERCAHFDPQVVNAFLAREDEVLRVRIQYADKTEQTAAQSQEDRVATLCR